MHNYYRIFKERHYLQRTVSTNHCRSRGPEVVTYNELDAPVTKALLPSSLYLFKNESGCTRGNFNAKLMSSIAKTFWNLPFMNSVQTDILQKSNTYIM